MGQTKLNVCSFEAKNRVFKIDYQIEDTFDSIWRSKKECLSLFDYYFSKFNEGCTTLDVRSLFVRSKKKGV